jgi:hypothetical protein
MKKQIVTLDINGDYAPELKKLTMPTIEHYAHKIGADFNVIKEEKFKLDPKSGHGGEKFQLYELSNGYDWTIFLDADALVHPNTPDWTEMVTKDVVLFHGLDNRFVRFKSTDYSRRSKCIIGACTWCTMHSDWCRDLWHPPTMSWEESLAHISPIWDEVRTGLCPSEHLIDDFTVSENIARFGLKCQTIVDLYKLCPGEYFFHLYNVDLMTKIVETKKVMTKWGVGIS